MSTLDTAALWSATSLAFDEKKLGAAGLSVRKRKLLALLNPPASVAQLAHSIALPDDEVLSALERFAKLGLAHSDAATPFNPMQVRATSAAAAVVEKPSRMPLTIGVAVASLALVAASASLLRGGSGKTSTEPAVAKTAPASPSTPTGPTDSPDSKLPRSAAAPYAAPPSVSPAAPTPAALPATAASKAAPTRAPAAAQGTAPAAATIAPTPAATTATAPAVVAAPTVAATAPPSAPPAAAVTPPAATPTTTVAAALAAAARPRACSRA